MKKPILIHLPRKRAVAKVALAAHAAKAVSDTHLGLPAEIKVTTIGEFKASFLKKMEGTGLLTPEQLASFKKATIPGGVMFIASKPYGK